MPSIDEIASYGLGALNPALRAGAEAVSGRQTVTFVKYIRTVLPADGFVFWVRASLGGDASPPLVATGSLHVATEQVQAEAEALGRVAVIFTSEVDTLQGMNALGPADLYIGSTTGDVGSVAPVRFAFSRLGFYQNAGLFHYSGVAVMPQAATQIVDDQSALDLVNPVVSSSLPAWLGLNNYAPFYGFGNAIPLYPSFLVPSNLAPPYGVVHVEPSATENLAAAPYLGPTSSHYGLVRERVRVTLYGVRHAAALSFIDCVLQFSQDYDVLGMMNNPVVRDERAPHAELDVIAQKKVIDFDVSYDQVAIRNIARQLITNAVSSFRTVYPAFWPVSP